MPARRARPQARGYPGRRRARARALESRVRCVSVAGSGVSAREGGICCRVGAHRERSEEWQREGTKAGSMGESSRGGTTNGREGVQGLCSRALESPGRLQGAGSILIREAGDIHGGREGALRPAGRAARGARGAAGSGRRRARARAGRRVLPSLTRPSAAAAWFGTRRAACPPAAWPAAAGSCAAACSAAPGS